LDDEEKEEEDKGSVLTLASKNLAHADGVEKSNPKQLLPIKEGKTPIPSEALERIKALEDKIQELLDDRDKDLRDRETMEAHLLEVIATKDTEIKTMRNLLMNQAEEHTEVDVRMRSNQEILREEIEQLREENKSLKAQQVSTREVVIQSRKRNSLQSEKLQTALKRAKDEVDQLKNDVHFTRFESKRKNDVLLLELDRLKQKMKTEAERQAKALVTQKESSSDQVSRIIGQKSAEHRQIKQSWVAQLTDKDRTILVLKKEIDVLRKARENAIESERKRAMQMLADTKNLFLEKIAKMQKAHEKIVQQEMDAKKKLEQAIEKKCANHIAAVKRQQVISDLSNSEKLRHIHRGYLCQIAEVNAMLEKETTKLTHARGEAIRLSSALEIERKASRQLSFRIGFLEARIRNVTSPDRRAIASQ